MNEFKTYIRSNIDQFQVFSVSSNKVMQFTYQEIDYIIKKQLLSEDQLSPFWQMMKNIFQSDFASQRRNIKSLCDLLENNPHIKPADFVMADDDVKIQVFKKMPGNGWEPDEFPEGKDIAFQLGQFIGYNHSINYLNYRLPGMNHPEHLKEKIMRHMDNVISLYWKSEDALDVKVRAYYQLLHAKDFIIDGDSLIMTDISANQFLFGENEITACVDLDAYVIGPKEWELALLDNCVNDMESFRKGYEYYQPFPNIDEVKEFYVFLMALNDIWGKEEMDQFFRKKLCLTNPL